MINFVIVMIVICGFQFFQDVYWLGKGGVERTYTPMDCVVSAFIFSVLAIWGIFSLLIYLR